jgi:hypothetical protein
MASRLHQFGFFLGVLSLTGVNIPLLANSGTLTLNSGSGILTSSSQTLDTTFSSFDGSLVINGSVNGIRLIRIPHSQSTYLYNGKELIKVISQSESLIRYDPLKEQIIDINNPINPSENVEYPTGNLSFEYNERNMISKIIGEQGTSFHLYYDENDKIRKVVNFSGLTVYESTESPLGASLIQNKEEQFDKITLIFSSAVPSEYHEVSYYRDPENEWNFGYDRKFTFGAPL